MMPYNFRHDIRIPVATIAAVVAASATASASAQQRIGLAFETNDLLINRPAIECADVCLVERGVPPHAALGWTPERGRRK
jgi:hypothetical protein